MVSEHRAELDALRAKVRRLMALYAELDSPITLEDVTTSTRAARKRIDQLELEMADAAKVAPTGAVLAADYFLAADLETQRATVDLLCTVGLHPGRKGRRSGWRPGERYATTEGIDICWREVAAA